MDKRWRSYHTLESRYFMTTIICLLVSQMINHYSGMEFTTAFTYISLAINLLEGYTRFKHKLHLELEKFHKNTNDKIDNVDKPRISSTKHNS